MLTETHRALRGHDFSPPANVLVGIPPLYGTEHVRVDRKVICLHYFTGASDWWIAELDPETGIAFGYVCLNGDKANAEWGYISLPELEAIYLTAKVRTDDTTGSIVSMVIGPVIVERDLHWQPCPFPDIAATLNSRTRAGRP
jgi:Protein of unknown function (DUF2958)